jgi:carbamoyltransferase
MQFVYRVRAEQRETIPAVSHADGTARVQTVAREDAPLFHRLIAAFAARTGVPVLVNTSFNTRGEPIVCTPHDALACYTTSALDALALGPYLLIKSATDRP